MADKPMRKARQDDVRAQIKTSHLIKRLADHGMGEIDLSATQISAINIILRKVLPDLSAISGADGGPIQGEWTVKYE